MTRSGKHSARLTLLGMVLGLAACAHTDSTPVHRSFVDLDGASWIPLDVSRAKASVLFFIASDCPIANGYAPEINAIVEEYAPRGVRFFLVHVDPDINREEAARHRRDYGYAVPVLRDPEHVLVRHTGATICRCIPYV